MKPEEFLIPTPSDIDNEAVVLCGMLRSNAALSEVIELLKAEDFSAHGADVYRAIVAVWESAGNRTVDAELVLNELVKTTGTPSDRWRDALLSILESDPSASAWESRALLVRDRSIRKQLTIAALDTIRDSVQPAQSAEDSLGLAQQRFMAIGTATNIGKTITFGQAIRELNEQIDRGETGDGIATGLIDLDTVTGGLHDGELCILACRPSCGKSALALNITINAATAGYGGLYFSLEMSRSELAARYLCGMSGIQSQHLRKGRLSSIQIQRLIYASHTGAKLPIWINDSGTLRSRDLRAVARKAKAACGIKLIVVDYLQLVTPDDTRTQRVEQVGSISRSLKMLARDLEIPILCLAQVNRQSESRSDGRPRLADLRESGSIEQDADTVIFMYRTTEPDPREPIDIINVNIAKQRNGPLGDLTLAFRKATMQFESHAKGIPL